MNYARLEIAKLKDDVAAATVQGDDRTCPSVDVELKLFQKFAQSNPTSGLLKLVEPQFQKVFNYLDKSFNKDDEVMVGQLIDETWVIIDSDSGGVACDFFRYKVVEIGFDLDCLNGPVTNDNGETGMYYAIVEPQSYPCGCTSIPGVDEYGRVKVYDTLGCFIFEEIDYEDKRGMAKYMQPAAYGTGENAGVECEEEENANSGCKWEIVELCCGNVMTPMGTALKYSDADEYGNEEYCIELTRVLVPVCPVPTTPSELCGEGPCPEADCPAPYDDDY